MQSTGEKLLMSYKRMYFTLVNHKEKKGEGEGEQIQNLLKVKIEF